MILVQSQLGTAPWNVAGTVIQPLLAGADAVLSVGKVGPHKPVLPMPPAPHPETSLAEVDHIVNMLDSHKQEWVGVSTQERARMLEECMQHCMDQLEDVADLSCRAKGAYEGSLGEEM